MCYFGTCRRPTNILTDPCKYCNAKYCQLHELVENLFLFCEKLTIVYIVWQKDMVVVIKQENKLEVHG